MKTDLELAQKARLKDIETIAAKIGLRPDDLELYGRYKAKLTMEAIIDPRFNGEGKVILVSAITPTPAGEGKTTTTIGLADALNRIGKKAIVCLREPSLGPVMGVKGGATGGGRAQVLPMEDINLHFTGDIHAVGAANNLIAAVLDNHLFQGNALRIDPATITWKRAMDMNDRALRQIRVGLSSVKETPRDDAFEITVASEIMAVLCLSRDLDDFRERVARIVVADDIDGNPVTVGDLKVAGAVTMLVKDAIKPNIVQTLEGNPALIHGGPFANIAHGCNSVMATGFARRIADYVVTESGFGVDLGLEKFMDIKTRVLGTMPSAVVVVASIRALKHHGGAAKADLSKPDLKALAAGLPNLEKHLETVAAYHVPVVVALNRFGSDSPEELDLLRAWAAARNQPFAVSDVFAAGGEGGEELARLVLASASLPEDPERMPLYPLSWTIKEKIAKIASTVYGAAGVNYSEKAERQLAKFSERGWNRLAVCMAKTQLSLSDDPKLAGRPSGFMITVREFKPSVGAGFIVALTGEVMTMPGLPKIGAYEEMDVVDGRIVGLF
jgi:formate--tetrahydrofolate ligase